MLIICTNINFIDGFIDQVTLHNTSYASDSNKAHAQNVRFASKQHAVENKIPPHNAHCNSCISCFLLKAHYEGITSNASIGSCRNYN